MSKVLTCDVCGQKIDYIEDSYYKLYRIRPEIVLTHNDKLEKKSFEGDICYLCMSEIYDTVVKIERENKK